MENIETYFKTMINSNSVDFEIYSSNIVSKYGQADQYPPLTQEEATGRRHQPHRRRPQNDLPGLLQSQVLLSLSAAHPPRQRQTGHRRKTRQKAGLLRLSRPDDRTRQESAQRERPAAQEPVQLPRRCILVTQTAVGSTGLAATTTR